MTERLQKIMAARGLCSRRTAEEWICAGRVRVNGETATLGMSADPDLDAILVDGKPLPSAGAYVYIMLHKPRGFVTTMQDERGRRAVTGLVECGTRVYPVGRLDMDSEGLLILTNDGDLAKRLTHPSAKVDKQYEVWVKGFQPGGEKLLERPIELDGYRIQPPRTRLRWVKGDSAMLEITIHEGRNRQIRRMCEAAHMKVTRLRRVREGSLSLGDLEKGKWRYLSAEELAALKGE